MADEDDREAIENIRLMHQGCAPKPGAYKQEAPEVLVGRYVKKAFTGLAENGSILPEHMWVKVERVVDGVLEGRLANDPLLRHATDLGRVLMRGDTVRVTMEEVEDLE